MAKTWSSARSHPGQRIGPEPRVRQNGSALPAWQLVWFRATAELHLCGDSPCISTCASIAAKLPCNSFWRGVVLKWTASMPVPLAACLPFLSFFVVFRVRYPNNDTHRGCNGTSVLMRVFHWLVLKWNRSSKDHFWKSVVYFNVLKTLEEHRNTL